MNVRASLITRQTLQPASCQPIRPTRLRSVASAQPYFVAATFCFLHYLAVLVTCTMAVFYVSNPAGYGALLVLSGVIISVALWFLSYMQRRGAHCSLCKGTPLANSGARPHHNAWRVPPLNHGTTAVLSIMVCQKYRCMYCGEDFDLLKDSASGYFDNGGRR